MRRIVVVAAAIAALFAVAPSAGQSVGPADLPDRIFLVWAPELEATDLASEPLRAALSDATVTLVSTRTAARGGLHAITLGSGMRVERASGPTLLARILEQAGYRPVNVVREGTKATVTARRMLGGPVEASVAGDLDDVAALPNGTAAIVDTGGDVAALAAAVADLARPTDLVIIAGVVPEELRIRHGVRLGVAAFQGPGFERGVLSSPTTRRRGLIAITDIAPTIASVLRVSIEEVEGRAAVLHRNDDPIASVERLEADLLAAHSARGQVTRTPLYAGMFLALGALVVARGARRRGRALLALRFVGLVTLALPISGFLGGSLGDGVMPAMIILAFAIALAGIRTPYAASVAIAAATALIPAIDLVVGSPIGHRSSWGVLLSTGGRFYGASEDTLGFIAAGALITAALVVRTRAHLRIAVIAFALLAAVAAAPGLGAKFGAAPTLVPAFAVFAVVALGRRVTWRVGLAIAAATIFATGGVILADNIRPEESRSHVARAIGGEGADIGALIARKWEANAAITFGRMWSPAALIAGGGLILLARRKRMHPNLRRAGPALAVVSLAALAANDGGVVTVAIILVVALAAAVATVQESGP